MRIRIEKICVATDFSDEGEHALEYGVALAEQYGAELHLLHVLQDFGKVVSHPDFTAENLTAQDFYKKMESTAQEQMESLSAKPWWEKLSVERIVRYGTPHHEICKYAQKEGIDLIVVGTHGRSGLQHVLMGSVAERVVRGSPCPVLTVRPKEHEFVVPE